MAEGQIRALVLEAPRELVVRAFPRPVIGEDDALLRVEACGLCGTDHEMWSGEMKKFLPLVPGHEAVGIIEEIGPRAADRWGVSAGDRVGLLPPGVASVLDLSGREIPGCERHRGDTYGSTRCTRRHFCGAATASTSTFRPTVSSCASGALDPVVRRDVQRGGQRHPLGA